MRDGLTILAGAAVLLVAGYAPAQYELDNSLQQGSGGINQPVQRANINAYNNAAARGDVAGFNAFRGGSDIPSPFEFRDTLSTDELHDFLRRSAPVNQFQNPQLAARRGDPVGPSIVIRPSGASGFRLTTNNRNLGGGEVGVPYNTINRVRQNTQASIDRVSETVGLGLQIDRRGVVTAATGSALSGVVLRDLGPNTRADDDDALRAGEIRLSPLERRFDPTTGLLEESGGQQREDGALRSETSDADSSGGRVGLRGPAATIRQTLGSQPLDTVEVSPALTLGTQLSRYDEVLRQDQVEWWQGPETLRPRVAEDTDEPAEQARPGTLDRLLLETVGTARYESGEDAYTDMLRRIAEIAKDDPDLAKQINLKQLLGVDKITIDGEVVGEDDQAEGEGEDDARPSRPLTAEEREQLDREAEARSLGMAQRPGETIEEFEARLERVQDALGALDYDAAPKSTIAGQARTAFHKAMREGEAHLKKGEYFEAEREFQRALFINSRHPFAQVGRMHAQIAAGMFQAASRNLRQLLVDNPQLIKARYTEPIIPPKKRVAKITDLLRRQIETEGGGDPAMLLAYMAYQVGDQALLAESLQHWKANAPRDRLRLIVSDLWQDESKDQDAEPDKSASDESAAD